MLCLRPALVQTCSSGGTGVVAPRIYDEIAGQVTPKWAPDGQLSHKVGEHSFSGDVCLKAFPSGLFSVIMSCPKFFGWLSLIKRPHLRTCANRQILDWADNITSTFFSPQRLWTSHCLIVFLAVFNVVASIGAYFHCNY